jgi:exopolyphosphatase/guanosine-5'-triphosphate,3'-diphosphate pyrophosphatase
VISKLYPSVNFTKILLAFCFFCILEISFLQSEIVRRAAVDIGSGTTKLTIADINTDSNQIVHIWYQSIEPIELRRDLAASSDGYLSKNIEEQLISTFKEMKAKTRQFAPQQWFGIGSSVFRTAKNGQQVLNRLKTDEDVTIRLVSHAEEGEIGFNSAVAASKRNPEQVISWDSGTGSFQISTLIEGKIEVYGAEFGGVPALEALFVNRKQPFNQNLSPNPITIVEASELVKTIKEKLPAIPHWLKTKGNKEIVGIGGIRSIFSLAEIAIGKPSYTKDQVWEAIKKLCGSTDEQLAQFPEPKDTVVELILLYSVMTHCGIDTLSYFPTNGSCEGLLIMSRFWNSP